MRCQDEKRDAVPVTRDDERPEGRVGAARTRRAQVAADSIAARGAAQYQALLPGTASAMELLVTQGIAREITGKRRNRLFVYERYLFIPNEGTEAP